MIIYDISSPTFIIQGEFVEFESAGLLPHVVVHSLGAVLVYSDGVFQRLHARLQAERQLRVSHRVPEIKRGDVKIIASYYRTVEAASSVYLWPSTVQRETPQRSGLNLVRWGMYFATWKRFKVSSSIQIRRLKN